MEEGGRRGEGRGAEIEKGGRRGGRVSPGKQEEPVGEEEGGGVGNYGFVCACVCVGVCMSVSVIRGDGLWGYERVCVPACVCACFRGRTG